MRVEPHEVGSIVHIIARGARGLNIVRDADDKRRFARSLFYLNDVHVHENWKRDTAGLGMFGRPDHWHERQTLVNILGWTLLSNHLHLIVQERSDTGISTFTQRLFGSMAKSFNKKYGEKGSLFQSSYKSRTVADDSYLRQIVWYVLVKNVFDLYSGGTVAALRNFEHAWKWGIRYPYSSFGISVLGTPSMIVGDPDGMIADICRVPEFKSDSKELLRERAFRTEELRDLALEEWEF